MTHEADFDTEASYMAWSAGIFLTERPTLVGLGAARKTREVGASPAWSLILWLSA